MIISASRRTDIPALYAGWFFNRIKEGFVLVRNPVNPRQVGIVSLLPEVTDGIVFWTKNPAPMMDRLDELKDYTYYFQFTLNPYGTDVEPNVPSKKDVLVPSFQKLSEIIGKNRVVWRYDPILFNDKYTQEYHYKYFKILASKLGGYTEKCTVSFLEPYRKTQRNTRCLNIITPSADQKTELVGRFSEIAAEAGIYIDTCAESASYDSLGVKHARCIDKERLERLGGYHLAAGKDKNQRAACGCAASVDIGIYNTCRNGCLYCYANYSLKSAARNFYAHDPGSPLLSGAISDKDVIKKPKVKSLKK